jgi:hypothetical protein
MQIARQARFAGQANVKLAARWRGVRLFLDKKHYCSFYEVIWI